MGPAGSTKGLPPPVFPLLGPPFLVLPPHLHPGHGTTSGTHETPRLLPAPAESEPAPAPAGGLWAHRGPWRAGPLLRCARGGHRALERPLPRGWPRLPQLLGPAGAQSSASIRVRPLPGCSPSPVCPLGPPPFSPPLPSLSPTFTLSPHLRPPSHLLEPPPALAPGPLLPPHLPLLPPPAPARGFPPLPTLTSNSRHSSTTTPSPLCPVPRLSPLSCSLPTPGLQTSIWL